jgi:tetratricopeptide (TPR) repeat protein
MKFTDVKPSDEELRIILEIGFLLREMSKFEEAATIFRGAAELVPESDVPLVGLGTVEFQQRNFAAAHEAYEKALQIKPHSLYARVHRAEAWLFENERERAEEELHEIIAADADSPHSRTAQALLDAADIISPQA